MQNSKTAKQHTTVAPILCHFSLLLIPRFFFFILFSWKVEVFVHSPSPAVTHITFPQQKTQGVFLNLPRPALSNRLLRFYYKCPAIFPVICLESLRSLAFFMSVCSMCQADFQLHYGSITVIGFSYLPFYMLRAPPTDGPAYCVFSLCHLPTFYSSELSLAPEPCKPLANKHGSTTRSLGSCWSLV